MIKRFVALLILILPCVVWGQSSLPPCPETGYKHNCNGSQTFDYGDKYVGEFKDGKRNGIGVWYRRDGTIAASGRWENDLLVQSVDAAPNRANTIATNQIPATSQTDPGKAERDRLATEVETERKKRQELEVQLAEA